MFIEALFTVDKTWKQPKCPSIEIWIKKMWYIYIQWNITQPLKRILVSAATWVDLEIVILSKVSQTEEEISYLIYETGIDPQT